LLLSRGLGVEQNDALALKVLEKSCKYGDSDPACRAAKALRAKIEKKKR
jgi:TPR repeat protein